MRSLPSFVPVLLTCAIASPSLADPEPQQRPTTVVAVFELRSSVPGTESAQLSDAVRRATREAMPAAALVARDEIAALLPDLVPGCAGDCAVRAGRSLIADLVVSGDVGRRADGFAVSLELRETREGELVGATTATAATAADLPAAAASAASDLFRPLGLPGSAPGRGKTPQPAMLAIGTAELPGLPAALGPAPEGLVVDYDVDADVAALYDKARAADAAGADHPEDAARAWNLVAQAPGENPFREDAGARAKVWDEYGAKKRAQEAQQASDTARLRKVLAVKWVSEWVKLDLVERYARSYGADAATRILPAAKPAALREKTPLALACEAKDAARCVELAKVADDAGEPRAAVVYLERACEAGSAAACTDAGGRFLAPATRDFDRAVSALTRGCDAKAGAACARLAQAYEEGDGTKVDLAAASGLRDRACAAGDGASCRRLACLIDPAASAAAKARAEELWSSGCAAGDEQSCALLRGARGGVAAPAVLDDAAANAAREYQLQKRRSLGIGFLAIGTVLGVGAAATAVDDDPRRGRRAAFFRRFDNDVPTMAYVLGAGAALSVGAGLAILFTQPSDPEPPKKVTVGVAPNAVLLSGPIP